MPIFQNQEIWSDLANMSVDLWVFKRCPVYLGINQMAVGWPPFPSPNQAFWGTFWALFCHFLIKENSYSPHIWPKPNRWSTIYKRAFSYIYGSLNLQLKRRHSSSTEVEVWHLQSYQSASTWMLLVVQNKWQRGQGDYSSQLGPSPTDKETSEFNRCKRGLPSRSHSAGICSYHPVHSHLK